MTSPGEPVDNAQTDDDSPTPPSGDGDRESTPGAIDDDQLPEDLRPDKNPLAANPDQQGEDAAIGGDSSSSDEPKAAS